MKYDEYYCVFWCTCFLTLIFQAAPSKGLWYFVKIFYLLVAFYALKFIIDGIERATQAIEGDRSER